MSCKQPFPRALKSSPSVHMDRVRGLGPRRSLRSKSMEGESRSFSRFFSISPYLYSFANTMGLAEGGEVVV